jgi:serine phosphatase RsbU (regulator of sigma subunit)
MGQVRNAMRGFALDHLDADEVMTRVRKLVRLYEPDELATILFGVIDPGTGVLRWANAGHPPPLVVTAAGSVSFLADAPCGPVGAPPPPAYPRSTHYARLAPGDTMLWFTDGLVEQRGESLTDGFARLLDVVGQYGLSGPQALDAIVERLRPRQGWQDDVCVLAVRRVGDS